MKKTVRGFWNIKFLDKNKIQVLPSLKYYAITYILYNVEEDTWEFNYKECEKYTWWAYNEDSEITYEGD